MKQILPLLATLLMTNAYAQDVSIELSIQWGKGLDLFQKDSVIDIPKLCITYRNNSESSIYFLKFSNSFDENPCIICPTSMGRPNYYERAKSHDRFTGESFVAVLDAGYNAAYGCNYWTVFPDSIFSIKEDIEYECSAIEFYLEGIYEYKRFLEQSNLPGSKSFPANITMDSIMENKILKAQFAFLKTDEFIIDTIYLYGFQMVEGNFTFRLAHDTLYDYVLTDPTWDKTREKWMETKVPLPQEIDGYKLYSGKFKTNQVKIEIK